ncbi:MAG TPA: hypothetical protein VGK04_06365 [Thermoanaerobaculia bacterium]|jgi:hypothetical protein
MTIGRPLTAALFISALVFAAGIGGATPNRYHLALQSSPASLVPLLSRFGTIDLHVYSGGVRAESMWLDSFSRNGSPTITLLNPVVRMYTEVGVEEFPNVIARMIGVRRSERNAVPQVLPPVAGTVNGVAAQRYRLKYDVDDWMDVWTTTTVPENAQLRRIVDAFVRHFAPGTAAPLGRIPGTPIYVEWNTNEHPRFPLLQMRSVKFNADGESKALRVGSWYFKAPLLDEIFR